MNNRAAHNRWVIILMLLLGILLQILPMTASFGLIKPNWLLLILVYWVIALPHRVSIGTAFILGIIIDLFSGAMLGVHVFAFCVVAYLATFKFQLIRNLALWQQSLVIIFLSMCYDLCLFILEIIINHSITLTPAIFLSEVMNGVIWLFIFLLLRYVRRRFRVY